MCLHLYIDVNECLDNNAGCAQGCINTDGTYKCICNSGFNLSSDMHNCTGMYLVTVMVVNE